jgi:hypothetical protein
MANRSEHYHDDDLADFGSGPGRDKKWVAR